MNQTNLLKKYGMLFFLFIGSAYQTFAQSKEDVKIGIGFQGVELDVNRKSTKSFTLKPMQD